MITAPQHFSLPQIAAMDSPHTDTGDDISNRLQLHFSKDNGDKDFRKHLEQSESALCIAGNASVITSDGFCNLDAHDIFYCRWPAGTPYKLYVNGVVQRVFTGPHIREQTVEATCPNVPKVQRIATHMIRAHEEAFYTTDKIVTVGKREIDILKAELPNTARKRVRLCCHPNTNDRLHEMFVLYTKNTYIQANKHLAKEETFLILEGDADFIFYSESGDVTQIIPLGSPSSGKDFFVRVPQGVYHSVVMNSDYLVIHESTPGPYDRQHTVWAPWAKSQGSRS